MRAKKVLLWALGLTANVSACGAGQSSSVSAPSQPSAHLSEAAVAPSTPPKVVEAPKRDELLDWANAHLPPHGKAERNAAGALVVTHEAQAKETSLAIAKAYLPFSETYLAVDLAKEIAKNEPIKPGKVISIPNVISVAPKTPDQERLAFPEDKVIRGIYLGGRDALGAWEDTLTKMEARGMNAVILDGKAYMGDITYPSKVKVAVDTGATKGALILDLPRTIRFAHKHGVRVSMRVACFHDPWAAEKAPKLSIQGNWGGPYPIGWLDPGGAESEQYIEDLVKELLDLGADEINLDYIRYPVQGGLGNADFRMGDRTRKQVITTFVHRIHEFTKAHNAPLSIDVFGVAATGSQQDVDALGQDIAMLGPETEAIMPMVYPSHYGKGYYGWDEPGNHPEIVAIGTKASIEKLQKAGVKNTVIRPWLQAFMWNSPEYGPKYLAQETVEAIKGGGAGWVMWNPGGSYWDAWHALPAKK